MNNKSIFDFKKEYQDNKKQYFDFKNSFLKSPYFSFLITFSIMILLGFFPNIFGNTFLGTIIRPNNISSLGNMLIWFIVGLGYSILLGYAGLASLGTAAFSGIGAYVSMQLFISGIPFFVSFFIVILIAILFGIILGYASLKINGMFLAIVTIGIAEIIIQLFISIWGNKPYTLSYKDGFIIKTIKTKLFFIEFGQQSVGLYVFICIISLLVIMFTYNIMKSPNARAMIAMKNSVPVAQAMGINVLKHRVLAFVLSTIYASIAGVLFGMYNQIVTPQTWSLSATLLILAAVVIGGYKSIWGIFVSSIIVFSFSNLVLERITFFNDNKGVANILIGLLIVLVVILYPNGILKLKYDFNRFIMYIKKTWRKKRYGK